MNTGKKSEMIEGIEKLGRIVFRAVNTKKQQPVKIGPLQDKTGKLYTGQGKNGYFEMLTPKEKENIPVVFDHSTVYTVEDGKILNIKDDSFDASLWKWIQFHPYIGMTRKECDSNRDAVFYVDNPQKTAEDYVSKRKRINKAINGIFNISIEQKKSIAKAMGLIGAGGLNESQVEEWLIMRAETSPDSVLALQSPEKASLVTAMGLAKEMLTYNVIKRFGTAFMYGGRDGISLGSSEEKVAEWISDTKNENTVSTMMFDLNENKGLV